jgi:hypothetical protein
VAVALGEAALDALLSDRSPLLEFRTILPMPKIKLVCFIPSKTENTDDNGNSTFNINIQGKRGPNAVTPGPNSGIFISPMAQPQFTLPGVTKEVFDSFVGKNVIVTIEDAPEPATITG